MGMDLDRDVTINGHEFKAGKNIDTNAYDTNEKGEQVKNDYADQIKAIVKANQDATDFAGVHHGEVATSSDPTAVTEQTPTRPLPDAPDASDPEASDSKSKEKK